MMYRYIRLHEALGAVGVESPIEDNFLSHPSYGTASITITFLSFDGKSTDTCWQKVP